MDTDHLDLAANIVAGWDFKDQNGNTLSTFYEFAGGQVSGRSMAAVYPANLTTVSAVGASTDWDYRSHYSSIDATLDFVAPSAGGFASQNSFFGTIHGDCTTDRTGGAGYVSGDYTDIFGEISPVGGTSMSSAIAAGVAGLVLSKDGNLTRSTVLSKMNENCDKVGPVAYTGTPPLTRNDYYGYGRLNAFASLNVTTADTTAPTFTSAQTIHYRAVDVTFSEPMGEGALTPGNYSITAGAGTLSPTPSKVIRISPTVYRLIWASGDMAPSGTVTIQASSSIKDVAGNALTTTSRNTTGTKRIIGVNCGNQSDPADGYQFQYTPPFLSDNGFQGNEPLTFLTSDTPKTYTATNITTSGVTDPAPMEVYQTIRNEWYNQSFITYSIPSIPTGQLERHGRAPLFRLHHSGLGLVQKQLPFSGQIPPHPGPLPSDGRGRIVLRRSAYPTTVEAARDGTGCSLSRRTGEGQGEGHFV